MQSIDLVMDKEFLDAAWRRNRSIKHITRDRGSRIDTIVGTIGEMMLTKWLWDDWNRHHPSLTHGQVDIAGRIEVKTSAVPLERAKWMLCREDYMVREAEFYVQMIIGTQSKADEEIPVGTICRIAGWATHKELASAPLVRLNDKTGKPLRYQAYALPLEKLQPMSSFPREEFLIKPPTVSPLQLVGAFF